MCNAKKIVSPVSVPVNLLRKHVYDLFRRSTRISGSLLAKKGGGGINCRREGGSHWSWGFPPNKLSVYRFAGLRSGSIDDLSWEVGNSWIFVVSSWYITMIRPLFKSKLNLLMAEMSPAFSVTATLCVASKRDLRPAEIGGCCCFAKYWGQMYCFSCLRWDLYVSPPNFLPLSRNHTRQLVLHRQQRTAFSQSLVQTVCKVWAIEISTRF